ncbi:probable serine/threonine-protein kinase DDB_G0282963 isoform X2 [Diabrotica virgifera virgifera]|uniref:Mif2/CENP-C cupin domain-containing protein n=1 Tax=Diabrotica virgifera virgifera TaxID=50390 RepID=A0ABM5JXQ4_DIAVI|nr:probable serine/threonine-protein kinase DDB_G0282963 isoform X2 [Diabrotica virgifera virgifera]
MATSESEHQTSETSWVDDDLDNTSFDSLVERVQQLVGEGVQRKKKVFRDNIEPLQLRPSIVHRALQKKIISSTPLLSKHINPKFLPDSSSVSSITDKELEERNEEISKDVLNVSDNNRLENQSKRKNQSIKGNKLKEKCVNNNLSNVYNNIDKNNCTHTSQSPHRERGSMNLERSNKVDGDGDFVIPNVLPEKKSNTNTDPIVSTEAKSSKIPVYSLRSRTLNDLKNNTVNENGRTNYATSKSVLEPISDVEIAQEVEKILQLNNSDKENSNQNVCVENKVNNDVEHRISQKPPIPKPRKKRMYTQTDTEITIHNNNNVDLPTELRPRVSEKLDPKLKTNVSVQTCTEFESPTPPKYRKKSRLSTIVGKITQIAQSKSSSSNKSRNLFKTTLPDTADKVIQTSSRPLSPSFISESNYTQDETEEGDVSSNESSILNYTRFIEESQKMKNLRQRQIKQNFLKKYRKKKAKDRLRRNNIDSNSLRSETINTTSSAEVLENIDLPDTPTRIQTMQNNRHVLQICNKWLSDIEKEKTESIISDRESIISDRESYCSHKNLHVSTHNTSKSILTINKDSFQNNINEDHDDESSSASKPDCSNKEYQSSINNPSKSISHVTNKTLVQNDINNDGDDGTSCTVIAPNAVVDQEYESPSARKINCVIKECRTSRNNQSKNISPVNKDLFEHEVNEDQDDEASLFHLSYVNEDRSDESLSARKSSKSNRSKHISHISHINKSLVQNDVNDDRDNEISTVIATNRSNKEYRISADNRSKNISSVDKASLQDDMHDGRGYESPSGRKRNSLFSQTPKDNQSKDVSHKKALVQSDINDDRDNEISSVNATNCSNKEYRISADNRSKNKSSVKASLQDDVNDGRGYASPSVMKRNSLISQTPKDNRSKDISHIKKALLESDRNDDRDSEISSVDATNCSNKEDQIISTDNRSKNISSVNEASLQDDMHDGSRYRSSSVGKRNSLISQTSKNNRSKNVSHTKKALAQSDRNDDRDNEISSVNATNCSNKEYRISTDNRSKNVSSAHKASLQSDENDDGGYESSSLRKTNFLISQTSRTSRPKNILPGNTASFLHDVDDDLRDKSPSKSYCSSKEIHLPQSCSKNILPVKKSLVQNDVNDDRDDESSDARRNRSSRKYRISRNNRLENISTVNEALVQNDLNDDRDVEPLNVSKSNGLNKENRLSTTNGPTTVSHVNKALLQNDVNDDESSDARRNRFSRKYRISRNNLLENISTVNEALVQNDLNDDRDVEPINVSKSNCLNKENRLSTTSGPTTVSPINKALLQNDVNDDRDVESSDARRSHRSSRKYRISRNNQLENISTVNGALDQDDLNDDRDVEPLNVSKSNGLNKENRLSTTNGPTTVSHVNKALLQNDVNDDESSDARRNRFSRKYRISRNNLLENISTVNEALVQNDLNDDRDVEPINVSKSNCLNKENRLSTTNGPTTVSPINKALLQNDVNDDRDDESSDARRSHRSSRKYRISRNNQLENISTINGALDQDDLNDDRDVEPLNVSKSNCLNKENRLSTTNGPTTVSHVNKALLQNDVNDDRDDESSDARRNRSSRKYRISRNNRLENISTVNEALVQNDLNDDRDVEPLNVSKSNGLNKENRLSTTNGPTTVSPINKALCQNDVNDYGDDEPLNGRKSSCSNKEYNMSTRHRSRNVSLQNNVNEVCDHEPLNVSKSIGSNKERQISTNNLPKNISSVNRSLFQGDVNNDRDEESPRDKRSKCSNKKVQISKKNRLKKSVSKALFQNDLTDDSDDEPLSANKSNCSNKEYQLFKNNQPTTISPIDKALFQNNVNDSDDDDEPLNTSKSNCSNNPSTNLTSVNKNKTENNPNLKTCSNTDDIRELRVRLTNHTYDFRQSPVQEASSQLNIDLGCENPINLATENGTAEGRKTNDEISNECDDHRVVSEHGVTRTPKRTKGPKSKRSKIGKNVTSTEATAESLGPSLSQLEPFVDSGSEYLPSPVEKERERERKKNERYERKKQKAIGDQEVRRSARERKPRILTYSMCIEISEQKLGRLLGIRRGERLTKSVKINSFNQSRCPTPLEVQKIKNGIRRNTKISTISENSNGESSSSNHSAIPNIVPCHQENTADPQDNINVFNDCQSHQMSNFSHTEIEERLNSSSKIKLIVENEVRFKRKGDNLRYSDLLTDKNGSSMLYLEIPPGESKRPHKSWKFNLFYFVNKGRGKVNIDGTLSEFRKGGRFFVPKGVTYSILNELKTKPMILACVRTPV